MLICLTLRNLQGVKGGYPPKWHFLVVHNRLKKVKFNSDLAFYHSTWVMRASLVCYNEFQSRISPRIGFIAYSIWLPVFVILPQQIYQTFWILMKEALRDQIQTKSYKIGEIKPTFSQQNTFRLSPRVAKRGGRWLWLVVNQVNLHQEETASVFCLAKGYVFQILHQHWSYPFCFGFGIIRNTPVILDKTVKVSKNEKWHFFKSIG